MSTGKAAIIFFGGVTIFMLMFEASSELGGFLGTVVACFTFIVMLYVTGVIGNKD